MCWRDNMRPQQRDAYWRREAAQVLGEPVRIEMAEETDPATGERRYVRKAEDASAISLDKP